MPSPTPNATASDLLSGATHGWPPKFLLEIVERYSWLIFQWCRNAGLSAKMPATCCKACWPKSRLICPILSKGRAKGSFRRWLRTDYSHQRSQILIAPTESSRTVKVAPPLIMPLLTVPDLDVSSLAEGPGVEVRRKVLWQLVDRLEDEFEESTWQAFWLTVIEGQTTAQAAAFLAKTPNAVRIAKWRVLTRLRKEAARPSRPIDRNPVVAWVNCVLPIWHVSDDRTRVAYAERRID